MDSLSNHNNADEVKLAVMQNDIQYIKETLNSVDSKVSNNYVTKSEFEPVRKVVYGLVAVIMLAFVGAVVSLVFRG